MIHEHYTSFDEINRDLKVLKLKRQIDEEKVKLAVQNTKEEFYPSNILEALTPLLQKLAISFMAKKLLQKIE